MVGLFIIAAFVCAGCIYFYFLTKSPESIYFGIGGLISFATCLFILFGTAQGKLYWSKFTAGYENSTWIVVDNSGGKTIRHWVLLNGYVKGYDQSDGWEFIAENCNPCYVGGDSFVGKISKELATGNYKEVFNIPEDQRTLH